MSWFSRKVRHPSSMRVDTLVGAGTRIHGDIEFGGGLHVDGVVQGNVVSVPGAEASLSVSDSGVIEGAVRVSNVLLNGRVRGDVIATQRLELGSTARVDGNVHYHLIEIALGACINGKLVHVAPGAENALADDEVHSAELAVAGTGVRA
jgi:cytoskeletal protein CcmA (bactofilin family)